MIHAILAEQREEMRQVVWENGKEPTVLVVQPELNEEQSEEETIVGLLVALNPK